MSTPIPHPLNTSGDFYVEASCCTACALPFTEAPNLFQWDGDGQCYVSKQPGDAAETGQMLHAIRSAELRCIRYRGSARVIQIQLVDAGEGAQCDRLDPDLAEIHRAMSARR